MKICPRCKSENIKEVDYMNVKCIICNDCGYDQRETYDVFPEDRETQREKRKFSPYKAGGGKRTLK